MGSVNERLLQQLAAAHPPPPPGWWPPAPGWWMLAAISLGLLIGLVLWLCSPARRLRRAARRELHVLQSRQSSDAALAGALEHLLRRYALARYGQASVARLSGAAWLAFLVDHGAASLRGAPGDALLQAAYGGAPQGQRSAWLQGAQQFIAARFKRPATPSPSLKAAEGAH